MEQKNNEKRTRVPGPKKDRFEMFKKETPVRQSRETGKNTSRKSPASKPKTAPKAAPQPEAKKEDLTPRLNKYVSNAGIASRRKADELIAAGHVKVNGEVVSEPGYRVQPKDKVTFQDKSIKPQEQRIYILLNKPRGVITTLSDEKGRKSIHDIIKGKVTARVFPVGRLDRDTTGLLLITNDGDMTKKLSHPSYEVKKIYHITLDKPLQEDHLVEIKNGILLEDGPIKVDGISYVNNAPQNEIGITLHSGRNRIIRRIFETKGYQVIKLDRVYYAGLTKKDLPRGMMRFLTKQEIIMLKHFI